ncbi:MAG TPA: sulfite exporter TauE/SafE family protein [Acidimicrobiia bacterium]|nr:sulfite exporter TauE/SafE family protein [Acidimicrobiia bacterium]
MDVLTLAAVVAVGAAVGFLGGLFGKGGAALATPLLAVAGLPAIVAVASPLPATIPATVLAGAAYWRAGLVDRGVARTCVLVGGPATAVGALATTWVGGGPLVTVTEVVLAGLGLRFLLTPHDPHEVARERARPTLLAVLVAVVVGLASGLLANSGGFLLAPLFVVVLRLPLKEAFGTSLLVAAALAVPGTIVHAALGHIDWAVSAAFAAAAVPFARVGVGVALRAPGRHLERAYGAAVTLLAVGLLAASA